MTTVTGLGWLTWRQHRAQVLIAVAFLVVLGGLLAWHGVHSASLAERFAAGSEPRRSVLAAQFGQVARVLVWSVLAPATVGLFWGAPLLAREYERGTYRLAWTQSVSRRAWLGVKLTGLGGAVALAGLAFGTIMSVWAGGFGELRSAGRLANLDLFVATGIVPAAWWLFAFALGTAVGSVVRKLLPAVAVTVAVFLAVYVGMFTTHARFHYTAPVRVEQLAEAPIPAGALLVSSGWTDQPGYRWFTYHPADLYWRFQLTEAGLLVLATFALGAVAFRRAR